MCLEELAVKFIKLGGGWGGDSVVGMDGECTCLAEAVSDPVSSEARLASVWRGWYGVLGGFLLDFLTIVANAVTSFRQMWPCFSKAGHPTSWWNLRRGGSSGLLKWQPGHDVSERTIAVMRFQGTPLGGG